MGPLTLPTKTLTGGGMSNYCHVCLDTTSVHKCEDCGETFCGAHLSPCRPNGWHGFETKKNEPEKGSV